MSAEPLPQAHQHLLLREIKRHRPDSLLLISPQPDDWRHWLTLPTERLLCTDPGEYWSEAGDEHRFELAVIADVLEYEDKDCVTAILSRLRDIQAGTLLVSLIPEQAPQWPEQEFFALGLKRLPVDVEQFVVYEFNLKSYKRTPDWLNSKYWANPEMFNKYRW